MITSCRYWPVVSALPIWGAACCAPTRGAAASDWLVYSAVLLKTHWTLVLSSVMKGSLVTERSNQKWTPVMGETLILSSEARVGLADWISGGSRLANAVCGRAKT